MGRPPADHNRLTVTVPSTMTPSASGYRVKVYNLTSGYDTEDPWAAPYRQNYFFYPFTASAPVIPDGRAGTADLAFGVEGTAHTGTATGQFSFAGLAGQAVKVHIQLVTDGGTVRAGAPELSLLGPDGNPLTGATTLDVDNGILEVEFAGADSMPRDGTYNLIVGETGGSAYRIELTDLTDLLDATGITAVSPGYTAVDPGTETVTITVQAAGGTVLEGVPVAFNGTESGFTLTDSSALASMAIAPPPPGTYEHVLVSLATAPQNAISFTIYTRLHSSQQMGMMGMPEGSEIIDLEIITEPQAVAGETQNLTVKAYEASGGSLAGATVTLTVASTSSGHFAIGQQTLDVVLPENGETTVSFTPGNTIACTGCITGLARRGNEPAASIVGINEITAVVYDGVSKNITKSRTVLAFPGEATQIDIKDRASINNANQFVDLACCSSLGTYQNTALVKDQFGNPVANHDVQFISNDNNLTLPSDAAEAEIIIPTALDYLPVSSSQVVSTDMNGAADVIWLMPRHTYSSSTLSASLTGEYSDTDSVLVWPIQIDNSMYGSYALFQKKNKEDTNPWRASDPTNEILRVIPYPYTVRLFDVVPYYNGQSTIRVLQVHVAEGFITFTDAQGSGRVGASPNSLTSTSIMVLPDAHTQAQAYWAPAPSSMQVCNFGSTTPCLTFDWSSHPQGWFFSTMPLNASTVFTARVAPMYGNTIRSLSAGGVVLAQEKEVILSVTRPHYMAWWLKVETDPLPNGTVIQPFVLDSNWVQSGNARYYYLPYTSDKPHTFEVRLPLNEVSDGASVTVKAVYAKNLWTDQNSGPPDKPENEGVLAEFKFKVGTFKIESIDFLSGIGLYSRSAQKDIFGPEWTSVTTNGRHNPPTTADWDENTSAPAAYKFGQKITVMVGYKCRGLDVFNLSADCDKSDPYTPNCPFGDIAEITSLCANEYETLQSTLTADHVSASMNPFSWKLLSTALGPEQTIEKTTHRIYSLIDDPKPVFYHNYIEFLELSTTAATDATSCTLAGTTVTKATFNQNWRTYTANNKYRFFRPIASIEYNKMKVLFAVGGGEKVYKGIAVYVSGYRLWKLQDYLQSQTSFTTNCTDINGLLTAQMRQIGCNFANYYIASDLDNGVLNRNWLTSLDGQTLHGATIDVWSSHNVSFDAADNNLIYDASVMIQNGAAYKWAAGLSESEYFGKTVGYGFLRDDHYRKRIFIFTPMR